ncbi:unnamed protein product [Nippostrongylus brasiliensis]|uniref:Dehydrogenase/reductase SDR family member 11 n=1 Tax=Nippostrongylus brasiliensis TaxID=27835 RepID=A0A0N4Y9H7_NIPBR|nr:unnamed protein product [Nippostrongylus brasiliensis]
MIKSGGKEENILALTGDLRNEDVQKLLISSTVEKFGGIDILVNNAGGSGFDNSSEQGFKQGMETYDYILNLNTRAALVLCRLSLPYLIERKGEIVMVSSICGLAQGCPALPYYSMSKAALDQLMRGLAVEYITKGVRVNSVNPGLITTTFMQKQGMSESQQHQRESFLSGDTKRIPAMRPGTSQEIAEAIAFLADRKVSSYVVGHTLVVDGGCSILNPLLAHYSLESP